MGSIESADEHSIPFNASFKVNVLSGAHIMGLVVWNFSGVGLFCWAGFRLRVWRGWFS